MQKVLILLLVVDLHVLLVHQDTQELHQSLDVFLNSLPLLLFLRDDFLELVLGLEQYVDVVVAEIVPDFEIAQIIEKDVLGLEVDIEDVVEMQVLHDGESLREDFLDLSFVPNRDFFEIQRVSFGDHSQHSLPEFNVIVVHEVNVAQFGSLHLHEADYVFVDVFHLRPFVLKYDLLHY